MNRTEIAAWVQVAIGVMGLILTALTLVPTISTLLNDAVIRGSFGPLGSAGSAIQVFAAALIVVGSVLFLAIGMAVLLGRLFGQIQAAAPFYAAFCVVAAMVLISVAATLAVLGQGLWIWPLLQALVCLILAGQGQVDPGKETFWVLMIVGSVLSFLGGLSLGALLQGDPFEPRSSPHAAEVQRPSSAGGATGEIPASILPVHPK